MPELLPDSVEDEDLGSFLDALDTPAPATPAAAGAKPAVESADDGDDPFEFLQNSGLQRDRDVPDIEKPWMKHHKFTRVTTLEEVTRIVDECITRGSASLDLETEGLDNRITYVDGKPQTVHQIVGFCISYDGYEGFYIPIRHRPTDGGPSLNVEPVARVEAEITRLCHATIPEGTPEAIAKDPLSYDSAPPKVVLYFWNAQFDHEFLYPVTGIDWWHPSSFEDGILAGFTKYAGDKGLGLKPKSKQYLRDPDGNPYEMIELKELFARGAKIQFNRLSPDEPGVLRYAGSDAICTYKLCQIPDLVPLCHEKKFSFTYRLEKQTTNVLRVMERNRVLIDRDQVRGILQENEVKRSVLLEKIQRFSKEQRGVILDPSSPKQLSEFLFAPAPKGLDISPKPEKTSEESNQYKTDGDTLEELAKDPNAPPILKDIVEYRGLEKLIGTYLTGIATNPDENNELRFSFKQTGAASGRFSAPAGSPDHGYSGIPIHGIPAGSDLRRVFRARPGYVMVKADYAGEELRIAANVSGETVWIKEFLEGSGDLHTITARAFFGKEEVSKDERAAGKIANFSLLYGGGPQAIVRATGCDKMEARRRKQAFDKAVPIFAKWIKGQHVSVKKELGVRTPFGRWLPIPDANHVDQAIQAACERHSVNYVIQGAGADVMKIALVILHKRFHGLGWLKNGDDSIRMLLTVHDEIVFEIKNDRVASAIPIIVELMESPWRMPRTPPWRVPLVVEPLVGFNWCSGFKVERHKEGQEVPKDEYLMNGFVYAVVRKPRTDKQGNVIEPPDIGEEPDGKKLRLTERPPWIHNPEDPGPSPSNADPAPTPPAAPPSDAVEAVAPVSSEVVAEAMVVAEVETKPEPSVAPPPKETPLLSATPSGNVLVLGINQLNDRTVTQVFGFVRDAEDYETGVALHLTDIVGETLIPPSMGIRVDADRLVPALREFNLLAEN